MGVVVLPRILIVAPDGPFCNKIAPAIVCGPNADQIYSLFGGTASHASPPTPFPGGGGALLREPYAPPNGRFRIDIRAAREYDSLLAPRPEKSI